MFKKLLVILFVLLLVGIGWLPWWTSHMAEQAFDDHKSPDAHKKVVKAIDLKMKMLMFSQAREVAEKAILYFPESDSFPFFIHKAALCAEKERKPLIALRWYRRLVQQFPKHEFAADAKTRIERLRGLNEE